MNKIKIKRIIFIILSLCCMVIIFKFSSDDGEKSSDKSNFFVNLIESIFDGDIDNLSYIVRKTAHFTIYAILGFMISGALDLKKFLSSKIIYIISICFIYACSDEIHQYFVPDRACRFQDVMIDTCGAFFGICVFALINKIINMINKKGA